MDKDKEPALADLVFVGVNSRVIALDRFTGEIVWDWKSPEGSGYVSVLLDDDRLLVGINGYVYCLDPVFGQEVWRNPLKGMGLGVTSIATMRGGTTEPANAAEKAAEAARAAAAS